MKKIILLTTILFLSTTVFSQVRIGFSAGYNNMFVKSNVFESEKPGSGVALGFSYKYMFTDNFNLLLEWDYANTKIDFRVKNNETETTGGYDIETFKKNGFRYHLLGNYNLHENAGILLGASVDHYFENNNGEYFELVGLESDWNPVYSVGLTAGIIGNYENFSADLRYTYGLTNPYSNNTVEVNGNDEDVTGNHSMLNFRVTYYFYDYFQ